MKPMMNFRGWREIAALLLLVVFFAGCSRTQKQDENTVPEVSLKDWSILRSTVDRYDKSRSEMEAREITIVQGDFRALAERNGGNRIGDEALYYIGRIFYDLRAYHDARNVFLHHQDFYPNSEFTPTIARLEAQMDKELSEYEVWLEQSQLGNTAR